MSSDYLYIAKNFHKRAIRVTLQDTLFTNSIKQKIQRCFSRFLYKRYFDKFWGIGLQQANYAKFIGFKEKDIYSGFYVAAKIFFDNYETLNKKLKKLKVNTVIHCATHYVKNHNFEDLKKLSNSNILFGNVILENPEVMGVKKFVN